MEAFKTHRGIVATLNRANVDTDQIIPKQFLKSISRVGFGENLFHDWARQADGKPNPDFELNRPQFAGATILVARNNFGCGSSREHAVWAVIQAGFRTVIAPRRETDDGVIPGFADIFAGNAVKNGLLTIELSEAEVDEIFRMVGRFPGLAATINLEKQRIVVHLDEEEAFHFSIDPGVKAHLMRGLDEIALTLQHEDAIARFEQQHDVQMARDA